MVSSQIIIILALSLLWTSPTIGSSTNKVETTRVVEIPVNLDSEREIQESVDQGHQPWRLDPVGVAHVALISIGTEIKYEDCKLESAKEPEATVIARKGKTIYRVYLKRLVRPDGIWTAIKIEMTD